MKTNDLTEAALDWAVAKCEGVGYWDKPAKFVERYQRMNFCLFSRDWKLGGAIIERESINLWRENARARWCASADEDKPDYWATSPLIAAMRCYVASRLGDEIEIPEELKND